MSSDETTRIQQQAATVSVGTQLSGIYELDERLASGGMGEVYRGHNIQTGDHVAIKIVLPEFARDETILSLFRKEASILNHLSHDAVVRYHVFSIDPGIGRPYLAMEFVDGEPLSDIIRRGPMAVERAQRLCLRLAEGLGAVHEAHTFHRDLSPDNIILPEGRVERAKIIDFGIARSPKIGDGTLLGGRFAGKYNYVSPEQLGLFGGEVGACSDIYSLGLVLAAALRGRPIDMSGSQWEVVEKRRSVPDLADIDAGIRPMLEAMLQPNPAHRPASMAEVAAHARSALGVGDPNAWRTTPPVHDTWRQGGDPPPFVQHVPPPILAQQRSSTGQPPTAGKRSRSGAILGGVAAVLLLGGTGAYLSGLVGFDTGETPRPDPSPPAPAEIIEPDAEEPAAPPPSPAPVTRDETPAPAPEPAAPEPVTPEPAAVPPTEPEPEPPAPPRPTPSEAMNGMAERVAWLRGYRGGDCFFATVTAASDSVTEIEGFGTDVEPFAEMLTAFDTRFGMEPTVNVRPIAATQCAVTEFLKALDAAEAEAPQLVLQRTLVTSGSPVSGEVAFADEQKTSLVLIDHKGMAFSLDGRLDVVQGRASFSVPIALAAAERAAGSSVPQVVLAIAASESIAAASFSRPAPAAVVLPEILSEIRARGLSGAATAKYFRLGG